VGINVCSAPLLAGQPYEATALGLHYPSISYASVLGEVIKSVELAVDMCERDACTEFIGDTWKNFDMLCGKRVRIRAGEKIYGGRALGVDGGGRFLLDSDTGEQMSFNSANARIVW
jgi:biotin-(acetyl-CoA carboxylase) ligase